MTRLAVVLTALLITAQPAPPTRLPDRPASERVYAYARVDGLDDFPRRRATVRALPRTTRRPAPRASRASRSAPWTPPYRFAATAACESTGDRDGRAPHRIDWRAVSPTGAFRGGYQFHRRSWQAVGGAGDPAAASPREQTARAKALRRLQGPDAWPYCGVFLR